MSKWSSPIRSAGAALRRAGTRAWGGPSREDLLPGSLAVLAAVLTVGIALELALPARTPLAETGAFAQASQDSMKSTEKKDLARHYVRDITRRPLFKGIQARPATRGRSAPAVPPPVAPTAAEDFELMGVIGGETPEAILVNRRTGKTYTVTVGQTVEGVTIREIAPRSVVVAIGERSVRIGL